MVPHNAFMDQYLSVGASQPIAERNTQIKSKVLQYMEDNLDKLGGRIVFYHESDPVTKIDNVRLMSKQQSNKTVAKC